MLKKQDDAVGAQPEFAPTQMPDSPVEKVLMASRWQASLVNESRLAAFSGIVGEIAMFHNSQSIAVQQHSD